jgi:hypothetical protein
MCIEGDPQRAVGGMINAELGVVCMWVILGLQPCIYMIRDR